MFIIFRWSTVSTCTQLFDEDQKDMQQTNMIRTEPLRKCQRSLKFVSTSESKTQKNLFNTKLVPKELSKLHKQV